MKKFFVLLLALLCVVGAEAKPRTKAEIESAARAAINKVSAHHGHAAPRQGELAELHKMNGLTVMGYENGGFAVVSNDDQMPEVLGVSDAHFSGNENPGFAWWLKAINEVCEATAANGPAYANVPTPAALGFEPYVDAIVTAEWDQEAPYSNKAPRDKYNQRCLTGCVATAISQVLYTHRTPIVGSGQRTNKKSYSNYQNPNGSYEDVTFVYDGWTPDYDNMIDQYTSGPRAHQYTNEQAEAVADLMLACGVVVNMSYGSDGSGAYTDQAAEGLIQYMGITTADFKERDNYSDTEWMRMIYAELEGGHAMYYSGVDPNPWTGGGHAFVCDGYNEQGHVHINWGWSGEDNGFFNINLLDPLQYEFSKYQDFIMGLWDPNSDTSGPIEYVNLTLEDVVPGTLTDSIKGDTLMTLRSLVVKGELNNDDIAFLQMLATGDSLTAYGIEGISHLTTIDLSGCKLANDELCDNAFKGARKLATIRLPRQLVRIGSNAFSGCSALRNITAYQYNVTKMGTRVFEGVSASGMHLNLIAGSSEYYRRNAQWKTIITSENITEFGTTLKAKNATRMEGQPNPVLGYQYYGERVVGTPRIWTEADETSEPGTYVIYIEAGTVADTTNVVFVNGTLTVKDDPNIDTGIVEVRNSGATKNTSKIAGVEYNLAGQKAGNKRGIRIVDGKKVVK